MTDTNDVKVEETAAEEPKTEEATAETPVADEQVQEEAVVEKTAGEPAVEEPAAPAPAGAATPVGTDQQGRQLYEVKCSDCGKLTQVPFRPSGDRPVYCRDCFMKHRS